MRVRVPVVMMLLAIAAPAAFGIGLTVAPFFRAGGEHWIGAAAAAAAFGGSCALGVEDAVRRLKRRAFRARMFARLAER